MNNYKHIKILVLIFLIGFAGKGYSQTVNEIVAKHITAMGGAEKLSKLKSIKIMANMEVMNMKMPVTMIIVQNKAFRSETEAEGMKVVQVVNGNTGWMINPMTGQNKAEALPEESAKMLSSQADVTGLYNYKEKGYTLSLDGEDDLAGAKVYKVGVTMKNGAKQVNYISKDTFYILKITASVPMNGQDIKTEIAQSDFKQVDGITFPFSSEVSTTAMPGMSMLNKVASVEVNPKIDESIFVMPKE